MRKSFCNSLKENLAKNEALCNKQFNFRMEQNIAKFALEHLQENFTKLYSAVENIKIDKQFGDKMAQQIEQLTETNQMQADELKDLKEKFSRMMKERDSFRKDTQELYRNKKIIEKNYAFDKTTNKERESKLNK